MQNRSFIRPVLHEATVQRTAEAPGGINLRHVAQARLAMPLVVARADAMWVNRGAFSNYLRNSAARTAGSTLFDTPRTTWRTMPSRSITTVWGSTLTL